MKAYIKPEVLTVRFASEVVTNLDNDQDVVSYGGSNEDD